MTVRAEGAEKREGEGSAGPLVLVVEDDRGLRTFITRVLERHGYEYLEAGSAEEALLVSEKASRPLDILIMDIMLPDSWGTRLAEDIRAGNPDVKVILTSGYTEKDPVLGAGAVERKPFLTKPFEVADLLEALRQVQEDGEG